MLITELEHSINDVLTTKCSKIYNSGTELYRGQDMRPFKDKFVMDIRQDRMPRDSSKLEAKVFDFYCEALRYPHRKSNTLSTSVKVQQAAGYSILVYQIFPFDDAQYLYSTSQRDFFDIPIAIDDYWMHWMGKDIHHYGAEMKNHPDEAIKRFINENLEKIQENLQLRYTRDPDELRAAKGEVLVYGSSFVGIFYDHLK